MRILLLFCLTLPIVEIRAAAQGSSATSQAVARAVALRGRFNQLQSAPVRTFAIASLGAMVCKHDPTAGSGLLRDAVRSLSALPDGAFYEPGPVLPISSFSALVSLVLKSSAKCDPSITIDLAGDRIKERLEHERLRANENLDRAAGVIESNPDRAAQLIAAAISAADPRQFDFDHMVRLLSVLRDRAPELSDELFEQAIGFAARDRSLELAFLSELGNYLFTAEPLVDLPDSRQEELVLRLGNMDVTDWRENRHSANPEAIAAYVDAIKTMLNDGSSAADPALAYATASQLVQRVREHSADDEEEFRRLVAALAANPASNAPVIDAALRSTSGTVLDKELDPERRRDLLVGQFRTEWKAGRFDRARELRVGVDDPLVRGQLDGLIRWGEAAQALRRKDLELALGLTNGLPAGAKRALLYSGLAGIAGETAIELLRLAWKDAAVLPAEQRGYVLTPVAAKMLQVDPQAGYAALNEVVAAFNEALINPRRGVFDPGAQRRGFDLTRNAAPDRNLLVRGGRGVYEIVDTGRSRHSFLLETPGVAIFDLPRLLAAALKSADADRLESILLDLCHEARRASALIALAGLRIKAADQK